MSDDWISIKDKAVFKNLLRHVKKSVVDRLKITDIKILTAAMTKHFAVFDSVRCLWIWCDVTRTAMRHILPISHLEQLDILQLRHPGMLPDFEQATHLKIFRCNHYMSEQDLLQISKSNSLVELGAQNAEISLSSIEAVLAMPELKRLDLEGSNFNDEMAQRVAEADSLMSLEIGASKLTSKGMEYLSQMTQLTSLDIWASSIADKDLEILLKLSQLEYLSIGGNEGQVQLTGAYVVPFLLKCQSLRRVWLDGIKLSESDQQMLQTHFDAFRYT